MAKREKERKERRKTRGAAQNNAEEKKGFLRRLLVIGGIMLLVLVIGVMIAGRYFDHPLLKMPGEMIGKAFTPVQTFFTGMTNTVAGYFRTLKYRSNVEYEYEQLLELVEELKNQAMLADHYQDQANKYADMLEDIQRNKVLDPIYAVVVGTDSGNYFCTIQLNRGSADGVEENMAVIDAGGLVGYTYNVKETTCSVKTIIDSDCKVAALLESTRDQGTVSGTMGIDGKPYCRMYYSSEDHLPRTGDTVVTSGVGVEFLKGVPIGTVRESTRGLENNRQYVVIEPTVDFAHLEYVLIYRYVPAYAEAATGNTTSLMPDLVTIPSARPIPTFAVGVGTTFEGGATPTPDPDATPTPSPTPTASPTPTVDPSITKPPENLSYQRPDSGTPSPTPMPTLTPTPLPAPTFNPDDVTVEDDT